MSRSIFLHRAAFAAALLVALSPLLVPTAGTARPVLLISLDGLRPGDVTDATTRGLKVPNLRRFLVEGAYAEGVTGILPTVTYPSHTTLITGAWPARHGIVNNQTFDPTQINRDGWDYYSSDIRVPTLWDATHAAHLSTGNVHWPVSVGTPSIDWNLPQIWVTGHADDAKLLAALATPRLLQELQASEGPYAAGIDDSIDGDELRARFAMRLITLHHPDFLTVYLTGLDTTQHHFGPDTPQAHAVLERLDAAVGKLIVAERAAHPDAAIAVVSDHGFAPVTKSLNLWRAFVDAGLVQGEDKGPGYGGWKITGWDAAPWPSGGSIAVVLAHPENAALRGKVADLLARLAADPANGIAKIIDHDEIVIRGGNPEAQFYINLCDGWMALPWLGPKLPLVINPAPYKGMHGYFPEDARMRSTFLLMGPGVPKGDDLGVIDMRTIAPTLAEILGVTLSGAELAALSLVAPPR
jgi:predicted AlkP superfamily pyrophosphatase or phosphodiesterase